MAISKSSAYESYRRSVQDLSLENLESLYRSSKLHKDTRSSYLVVGSFAIVLIAMAVHTATIGIMGFWLAAVMAVRFSFRKLDSENLHEKVIQDIFQKKGKQIVFRRLGIFGLSGFSTEVLTIVPPTKKY